MRKEYEVHISQICVGDTVFHNGADRTVGAKNLRHSAFMGTTLFGDCYKLGLTKVKKVIFVCEKPKKVLTDKV